MWLYGELLGADAPPAGVSDQLIIMVGGIITAALTLLGGVLVAMVNSRSNRTAPSPPAPTTGNSDHVLYERTAVLTRRADDADDRFHVMDLARTKDREDLDDVLDYLDHRDPGWRN